MADLPDNLDNLIVYRGARFTVVFGIASNGSSPARDFFETLSEQEQAKMIFLFTKIGDHGMISNPQQYKKLEGANVSEFKKHQIRISCFIHGKQVVLLHGFKKQQDKWPKSHLERAERLRLEHLERAA